MLSDNTMNASPHFLLLEPYYGGSHRSFLQGLQQNVAGNFSLISLPARKWKMRMQLAAPWFAEQVIECVRKGSRYDAIISSTFLDAAVLKTMLCKAGIHLPLLIYFHENQFAYPNQVSDPARHQFTALNFTSALAAEALAFNSRYNLKTFVRGVEGYLKKAADMNIVHLVDDLQAKAVVLYPGIDFNTIDAQARSGCNKIPKIVWNHRWEHDKDPETFFQAMYEYADQGLDFQLIVLGQSFERQPKVFSQARERLHEHIDHFGYVESRDDYIRLLHSGDIVVSTARHEYFGMAVLEAVRSGCLPVVPDRLAYRELFPEKYRYKEDAFKSTLKEILLDFQPLSAKESLSLTEPYSWPKVAGAYGAWLASLT